MEISITYVSKTSKESFLWINSYPLLLKKIEISKQNQN